MSYGMATSPPSIQISGANTIWSIRPKSIFGFGASPAIAVFENISTLAAAKHSFLNITYLLCYRDLKLSINTLETLSFVDM